MKCLALKALATNINGKIYMDGLKAICTGEGWTWLVGYICSFWSACHGVLPANLTKKILFFSFAVLRVNHFSCLESGKMKI